MLHRLAEDLRLSDDGILAHRLGHEHVVTSGEAPFDVVDGVGNVPEVDAVVLHNRRASARSRRSEASRV